MSKKGWGALTDLVLLSIREEGPMSRRELADWLNVTHDALSIISKMSKAQKRVPKRLYICKWVRELDYGSYRRYLRPVYDIGDHVDAKKPKSEPNRIAGLRAYRKKRDMGRMNSIFNLGLPAKEAEQSQRKKAS
jgi:hypothetical protein